jgi:hypothetical protein
MACEKYSGWIIDAALGALPAQRNAELAAHTAHCASCRESLAQSRAFAHAIDAGVESLVASEPSPQFHARLRSRLADEAASRPAKLFGWLPVAAAATAAVVLAAFLLFRAPARRAVATVAVEQSASDALPVAVAGPNESLALRADTVQSVAHPYRAAPDGSWHPRPGGRQQQVLIRPGQLAMLQDVAQAARTGRFDVRQLSSVQQEKESESPLAVEPMSISALEVAPLPAPAPVASGS